MIACSCIHWLGSVFVSETNWGYSLLRAWQACSCGWHVMLAEYQGLCRIKSRSHFTGLWLLIGRGLDLARKKKKKKKGTTVTAWDIALNLKIILTATLLGGACSVKKSPCTCTMVSRAVFCLVRHTPPAGLSLDLQMFLQVLFPLASSLLSPSPLLVQHRLLFCSRVKPWLLNSSKLLDFPSVVLLFS